MLNTAASKLGLRISRIFHAFAPDPFVLAVLLTLLVAVAALTFGEFEPPPESTATQSSLLLDAWRADSGMWKFLGFSMQMCLILVTGHALAASKPVRAVIESLAAMPKSGAQAAAMIGVIAAGAGLINWGFGLIVGALLARDVARSLSSRGVRAHYPVLCAAGYMGLMVWHGGLSGSAPLTVTSLESAAKVLPEPALVLLGKDGIPLSQTLFTPMNLFVCAGLLAIIPLVLWMLTPRDPDDCRTIDEIAKLPPEPEARAEDPPATIPEWLERTPPLAWLLAVFLLAAVILFAIAGTDNLPEGRTMTEQVLGNISGTGLNEINMLMLALGLILHGSLSSYARAVEDGARGCAGIMIQFPLYAGIMVMLKQSGLVEQFAELLARGGETGVPILTFISAGVVNFFVPSGGGQWGIQGEIALQAGLDAGVAPGKMVMAVAYGDQLTNMLQPFWALPLLAITGAKARDIVGYTAIVMVVAAIWITLGLLLF